MAYVIFDPVVDMFIQIFGSPILVGLIMMGFVLVALTVLRVPMMGIVLVVIPLLLGLVVNQAGSSLFEIPAWVFPASLLGVGIVIGGVYLAFNRN